VDAAGGRQGSAFHALVSETAAASASMRCASSTSWPPTPAPRWGSDGPSCLSPCSACGAPPSRGPARSSMSVLPPAACRAAPAVVFYLCRSPRGAQRPLGPGLCRAPISGRRHRGTPRHSRPRRRFPNAQRCLGTPPCPESLTTLGFPPAPQLAFPCPTYRLRSKDRRR
jgi:hypothetical protein